MLTVVPVSLLTLVVVLPVMLLLMELAEAVVPSGILYSTFSDTTSASNNDANPPISVAEVT